MSEVLSSTPYRALTEKIIEAMKGDLRAFKMPWHTGGIPAHLPVNASTDAPYRGVNVLSLWIDALRRQYPSGYWASYKQWQSVGAQVRKGEHGSQIVFYKPLNPGEPETAGEGETPRFVARMTRVFNGAQVEGWTPPSLPSDAGAPPDAQAEAFVSATGARIRYGFHTTRYRRDLDDIEMPSPAWFTGSSTSTSAQTFYAVLLHELTHWTGATHRLSREFGKRFGDRAYAFEELVAELGAAFLCAALGIANEPRPDHAVYLSSWLKVLEGDARAIFLAASKAQEAAEYLTALASDNKA
jgi:antirestriction protein ArdC